MTQYGYGTDISGEAGADLRNHQYHAVKFNAAGLIVPCSVAGEASIGVLQNDPDLGQAATVRAWGKTPVVAGAAIVAGLPVGTNAQGRLVNVVAGFALGIATAPASGVGVQGAMLINNLGLVA